MSQNTTTPSPSFELLKVRALAQALGQYVENSEEVENEMFALDRLTLYAARVLLEQAERELAALAGGAA